MKPVPPASAPRVVLLQDYLRTSASRHPEKTAVVSGSERISYAELLSRVSALSNALVAAGVARGDRVLVFGDNTTETVVDFFAAIAAGAAAVMVSPLTRAPRFEYLLEDTRAVALLTSAALVPAFFDAARKSPHLRSVVVAGGLPAERLASLPGGADWSEVVAGGDPHRLPDVRTIELDLAVIIYTSGSTGAPKGVMHTHGSLRSAATSIGEYLELTEEDVLLGALPLSFGYGLFQVISAIAAGGTVVLERGFTFPSRVLERVATEGVTCFAGVPSVFALLGGLDGVLPDLSAVRLVTNAAAALGPRHAEVVQRLFPAARLFSMYGQTECIRGTYVPPRDFARKSGSMGIAIPNTEAWVVDEGDRPLPPGHIGQLVIRGPHLMRGYWERPTETAAKLRPGPLPGELVLHTGDLVRMDEDGFFHFVSRMDDVIKSRGEKVAPREVESVIGELERVREVAVVGVPDDLLGFAIKAFVVLEGESSLSPRDVQRHCQSRLESYMVPKEVVFIADLPKTASGKIDKLSLT